MAKKITPWKRREIRVLDVLRDKLAEVGGVTVVDRNVTVRFTDPKTGQFMTVAMVAIETDVYIPEPECPKGELAAAKKRREEVRQARVKDDWASPGGPGGWLCPSSPIGYCWYDDEIDPLNDNCLGCGFPRERK